MPMSGAPMMQPAKHHNWMIMMVFLLVAVIIAVLLMFIVGWAEFTPPVEVFQRPATSFEQEVESLDTGNVDQEFLELDAQINGL